MNLELDGRVALVTGASIGIGHGIARALAAEGVRLALLARRGDLLEKLDSEIRADGGKPPLLLVRDVTSPDTPVEARKRIVESFGRLDILVNNAGGSRPTNLEAYDRTWQESYVLNFESSRRLTHELL